MTSSVVDFDTRVAITVHGANLAASGVLLCDPIAHITLVTAYTTVNVASATQREVSTTMSTRRLVSTERKVFTAHPNFEQTFRLVLPHNREGKGLQNDGTTVVNRYLAIDLEGAEGEFLGQAVCPFSLSAPSQSSNRRLMLLPRNAGNRTDALFKLDNDRLEQLYLDDFGHIKISYDVSMAPRGGVLLNRQLAANGGGVGSAPMPLPMGVLVKGSWLANKTSAIGLGKTFTAFVDFGEDVTAQLEETAAYLTLRHVPTSVAITCIVQKGAHGAPQTARIPVPMQPATPAFMDRDVNWCYPVYSPEGGDWGVIMISLRLTPMSAADHANDRNRMRGEGYPYRDEVAYGDAAIVGYPQCPPNVYGRPLMWENDAHIARSKQRRWRRDCVTGARPTPEHVRHIFEATLNRVTIDEGVLQLVTAFFNNKSYAAIPPAEMRELLIAMAFVSMPLPVALKFSFAVMRTTVPNAIQLGDIVFILEHCLAPWTLDMPFAEIERRAKDVFSMSPDPYISYNDFVEYFAQNDYLWYECGVAMECGAEATSKVRHVFGEGSSAGAPIGSRPTTAAYDGAANESAAANTSTVNAGAGGGDASTWRTFTVRVVKTGRAFNVTAHVNDVVADVMTMVEPASTIAAHRQAWVYEGIPIDARRTVGSILPLTPSGDVSIMERDEAVLLVIVYRDRNKRWEHRFPLSDKVLKLRAYVQQKSMIPLSRCVLKYAGNIMWDRHGLDHYKLTDGAIIEVSTE